MSVGAKPPVRDLVLAPALRRLKHRLARGVRVIREHPFIVAILLYGLITAIVFRDGVILPSGSYPQGTNALNMYSILWFQGKFPWSTWLYPYTDWGQPYPGVTGPTLLTLAASFVDPASLTRLIEMLSFFGSGIFCYVALRHLHASGVPSLVAGAYYSLAAESAQLFEGHVPIMVSLCIAPIFLLGLWTISSRPSFRWCAITALLLYMLASIGDIGVLYMLILFGVPLFLLGAVQRNLDRIYTLREVGFIVAGAALFVVLMLPWIVPFVLGARPEYTTGITVGIVPFSSVFGSSGVNALLGIQTENSFILFTYGFYNYGIIPTTTFSHSLILPVLLSLPLALGAYVVLWGSRPRVALLCAALLAAVIATGNKVWPLSSINMILYSWIPYFNYNPTLARWSVVTDLAYALLIGLALTDLEKGLQRGILEALHKSRLSYLLRVGTTQSGRSSPPARYRKATGSRWVYVGAIAIVVAVAVSQNALTLRDPPGTFQYPSQYTAGIEFLSQQGLSGGVMSIPFAETYERTPWGGVSLPASLFSFTRTGSNLVAFEAGTPYSLALDYFIGDGMTYNISGKMLKFLGATNVEYILATKYPNWSYASSSLYNPISSYYELFNQSNIGAPVYEGGYQEVFRVPVISGNVSFDPTYFVYLLNQGELYSVLNSSWYFGPEDALIDGSSVGTNLPLFIRHAAAVIVPPSPPLNAEAAIQLANRYGVPVISPSGRSLGTSHFSPSSQAPPTYQPDFSSMPDPTRVSFVAKLGGWGVITLAETFSNLWSLSGGPSPGYRAVSNLGLNGWLVNSSVGSTYVLTYTTDGITHLSFEVEVVMLILSAALILCFRAVKRVYPRTRSRGVFRALGRNSRGDRGSDSRPSKGNSGM